VTAEQVLAVMRKHIDMNLMSMIQAGDFAPKAKAESAAK
jgi:hypothetical protein